MIWSYGEKEEWRVCEESMWVKQGPRRRGRLVVRWKDKVQCIARGFLIVWFQQLPLQLIRLRHKNLFYHVRLDFLVTILHIYGEFQKRFYNFLNILRNKDVKGESTPVQDLRASGRLTIHMKPAEDDEFQPSTGQGESWAVNGNNRRVDEKF